LVRSPRSPAGSYQCLHQPPMDNSTTNYFWECFVHSSIHSVFCLMTSLKPPPKRFLHIVRSRASSFK
jgi:hypothetical protein